MPEHSECKMQAKATGLSCNRLFVVVALDTAVRSGRAATITNHLSLFGHMNSIEFSLNTAREAEPSTRSSWQSYYCRECGITGALPKK
jgi:hypothetical protein